MDYPFYSGELVVAKVAELRPRFAILSIRRVMVPINLRHIDWNSLRSPEEKLSVGNRVDVAVYVDEMTDLTHKGLGPDVTFDGVWASRLPLLENPWPNLTAKYKDGDVVEVEMIDYLNWYIARVRLPEGLIVELRTNDIHPRSQRPQYLGRKLNAGERFKVVFRKVYSPGGWVERYFGGSTADCLTEAGYLTPRQAQQKLDDLEKAFLKQRYKVDEGIFYFGE